MPPKPKKSPKAPVRPASAQSEVQDEQVERPPPRLNEDVDISFSDDAKVHDHQQPGLDTNKNNEKSKGPEEQEAKEEANHKEGKVSDGTLFEICCSDLGITQQGLDMMTGATR